HPGAIAAARRIGLDLSEAVPQLLDTGMTADLVVTVCDRAHEELDPAPTWWHWSLADPVADGRSIAFDDVTVELERRISALVN
ncbi:MAG: ArsR family transcriptional regulator, partial [Actinomycetota bacterium]